MLAFFTYVFLILFIVSIAQIVRAFLHKSSYRLKLHAKYTLLFFILSVVLMILHDKILGLKINSTEYNFQMFSIPIGIILSILIDKSGFDIFTKNLYMNLPNTNTRYGLRRDYFSLVKIALVYLVLIIVYHNYLWKYFSTTENLVLLLIVIIIGIIHSLFFSKLSAICPYCDGKISNISVNTGAFTCKFCHSRIVIENDELLRPRGRSIDMSN